MKYYIKYAILSAILLLAASCSSNQVTDERLLDVENIMDERPDSALQMLQNIDYNAFDSERDKALYFIYLYQATDKLHIMQSTDSLITISCNYFDGTDENLRKLQSYYYCSKANFYGKNYVKAITKALDGEMYVSKIDDPYWKAKIYELLADIYYYNYHPEISNTYRIKCIDYYSQAGKFLNTMYATADRAFCYYHIDCDSMLLILDECLKNNIIEDSICLGFFHEAYIRPLNKLERYNESLLHFREAKKYLGKYADEYIEYPGVAWAFIRIHELDSAKKYLDRHLAIKGDVSNDDMYHNMYSLYLSYLRKYEDAYEEYCTSIKIINNRDRLLSKNDIGTVVSEYHSLKLQAEKVKASYNRIIFVCIILIMSILIVTLFIVYRLKYKEKIRNFENEMLELIRKNNEDLLLKQEEIERILNTRYEELNGLFDNYYYIKDTKDINSGVNKCFNQMMEQCKSREYLKKLEETINQYKQNVLSKIREQVKDINENEMMFLSLLFSGFSLRAVCLIAGINTTNYYTKRRRLKLKIENSDAQDKSLIMAQFEKISNR